MSETEENQTVILCPKRKLALLMNFSNFPAFVTCVKFEEINFTANNQNKIVKMEMNEKVGESLDLPFITIQDFMFQNGLKETRVKSGPQEIAARQKMNHVEFEKAFYSAEKTVKRKLVRKK